MNRFSSSIFLLLIVLAVTTSQCLGQQPSDAAGGNVSLTVTVTDDQHRSISGLRQEQFSVLEKNTPLEITSFDAKGGPASVAFVLDLSSSMAGKPQKLAVQLAGEITRAIPRSSDYLVVAFNQTPHLICGPVCGEPEATRAFQVLAQTKSTGNTAFFDACYLASMKLESSKNTNRVLIVFSDGTDNASQLSYKKLREALKGSSVTFYAVVLRSGNEAGSSLAEEGDAILKELSTLSGGQAYFLKDQKSVLELADVIAEQINQHYTIGFKPLSQSPDKKWHSIKIKLEVPKTSEKRAHYNVRYRPGYYSH